MGMTFTRGGSSSGGGSVTPASAYEGLCFTAVTAGSTVSTKISGTVDPLPTLEYSTDGVTWNAFTIGETGTTVTLSKVGDKVYFRGNNDSFSVDSDNYVGFKMTGSIAASGNIMSLADKTCSSLSIPNSGFFQCLFYGCTSLNEIKVHFTSWDDVTNPTEAWVTNVPSGGTFTCPSGLPNTTGDDAIPAGWTKNNL